MSERCGTSQAALRFCPSTAFRHAAIPITVLPAPVGATTSRFSSCPRTSGTMSACAGLSVLKGRNAASDAGTGVPSAACPAGSTWSCHMSSKASLALAAVAPVASPYGPEPDWLSRDRRVTTSRCRPWPVITSSSSRYLTWRT